MFPYVAEISAQTVTIVGIPVALANLKMIPVTCFPFGRKIVDSDVIPHGWEPMSAADNRFLEKTLRA